LRNGGCVEQRDVFATEGDAPYAILVFAAMLPWQFFSAALSSCSESLISNANLLT
jgi:lipopolysaccharide transport system permease protein